MIISNVCSDFRVLFCKDGVETVGKFCNLKMIFGVFLMFALSISVINRTYSSSSPVAAPETIAYHHEQVIAIVTSVNKNTIIKCRLIEVITIPEALRALDTIPHHIIKVGLDEMMGILDSCLTLATLRYKHHNNTSITKYNVWTWIKGIMPGTKWCGRGDIAKNYEDLGSASEVDICCRAHDHCPVKVKSFMVRYELLNLSFTTKSACRCDEQFFICLKNANSTLADLVGNMFFNIIKTDCIRVDRGCNEGNFCKNVKARYLPSYVNY